MYLLGPYMLVREDKKQINIHNMPDGGVFYGEKKTGLGEGSTKVQEQVKEFTEITHFNHIKGEIYLSSVQFSSVSQSCPTLCNPMNRSTPGLPVHHQLPEFTQTHVHQVSDAIQPSHPLSCPSLPAPNHSQHQGLFQ